MSGRRAAIVDDPEPIPSLKDRVQIIQHAVTVTRAIVAGLKDGAPSESFARAAEAVLEEADLHIYWLGCMPEFMLNIPIPTDDDVFMVAAPETPHEQQHEQFWIAYMRDTFRIPTTTGGVR